MSETGETPRRYRVEISEPAEAEIEQTCFNLMARTSADFADRWHDGLLAAIANLAVFPTSHPIEERESRAFGRDTFRLLYRQGRIVYNVFFTLLDSTGGGTPDTVRVLHIRNAVRDERDAGDS